MWKKLEKKIERPTFKDFKEDVLKNAKVREEYEALRPKRNVSGSIDI